jgi:hypothetical protein
MNKKITSVIMFARILIISFFIVTVLICCKKKEHDITVPEIDLAWTGTYPALCDTLIFGNTYNIRFRFTDDIELSHYSIDIVHNFQQQIQIPEPGNCTPDHVKPAVYPFNYSNTFQIPEGKKEFTTNTVIWFPEMDCCNNTYDEGDYVFLIRLTDKAGLFTEDKLSVKLLSE